MAELDFNSIFPDRNLRFVLVVCPRCREHAQVLEQAGKKTTRCQHCGALLKVRKLRIFYSSDELSEAVAARTRLQARLSGEEGEEFFENLAESERGGEGSTARGLAFGPEKPEKTARMPVERAKKAGEGKGQKKSSGTVLRELLEASGGKMELEGLERAALERGLTPEKFEKVLKGLLAAGELYSPSKGVIKLV